MLMDGRWRKQILFYWLLQGHTSFQKPCDDKINVVWRRNATYLYLTSKIVAQENNKDNCQQVYDKTFSMQGQM